MLAPMEPLPYKIACLCDLRDARGRHLLLLRKKQPNLGLCSPIGGKLDIQTGESPHQCAQREIMEEAGIHVPIDRLHLVGLIAERAFEKRGHWLLFYFIVTGAVEVEACDMDEGRLDWYAAQDMDALPIPETDRRIIWPLVRQHEATPEQERAGARHGFFSVFIDCSGAEMTWRVEQSIPPG
jgi:8-oxo-dGTP diphosphatase